MSSADFHGMLLGRETASGEHVSASSALNNSAVLRCVSIISESIGMLPLTLFARGDEKEVAKWHPLYKLLKIKPNDYQGAYKFKSTMQLHLLQKGNAYARVVRSGERVIRLVPLNPDGVTPKLNNDWTITYQVVVPDGSYIELKARDVLHLADLSEDGIKGISRVDKAREAIGLSIQAHRAAARLFKNGIMAGGALLMPGRMKDEQIRRVRESLNDSYSGADNASKWMVLEDGIKPEKWANTANDSQHIENRRHQIEEIARYFGVPRPLLMMDDTSWGSGIEQLGIFFVQYGLQHWFTIWEEAIINTLLTEKEAEQLYPKFNEKALLRGTTKDQADFFSRALGAGGHSPWLTQNEVRELSDLPKSGEGGTDSLHNPMTTRTINNEPNQTP